MTLITSTLSADRLTITPCRNIDTTWSTITKGPGDLAQGYWSFHWLLDMPTTSLFITIRIQFSLKLAC